MSDAICVGVLDVLAHPVGAGVHGLHAVGRCRERVAFQIESVSGSIEAGVGGKVEGGQSPEQVLKATERVPAGDADALDNLLIEVVEELLAGVVARLSNLRFEFLLELIELELDLFGRAALLVDADDALLEVDAGLDGTQDLVAGSEDAIEEAELLREKLVDALVGGVALLRKLTTTTSCFWP